MSQLDQLEMQFSGGGEAPELDDYRPISPLVIVACIASLASLLALLHPLLWSVPIVSVVLSICAIRQVSAPQSRYGGRSAALAALCFAGLIGTYAPARVISRERELYALARTQAEEWISLIQQGRFQEAHQFSLGPMERFQGPGSLANHYRPPAQAALRNMNSLDPAMMDPAEMMVGPSAEDKLNSFQQDPVIAKVAAAGEQGSIALVQNVSIKDGYGNAEVTQRFRVSGVDDAQPGGFEIVVKSTRWEALEHANWQCGDLKEVQ